MTTKMISDTPHVDDGFGVPTPTSLTSHLAQADNPFLDWFTPEMSPARHPVFGRVIEGYDDVVVKISRQPTDKKDRPKTPVRMIAITVERA